jgi:hypothetical protein
VDEPALVMLEKIMTNAIVRNFTNRRRMVQKFTDEELAHGALDDTELNVVTGGDSDRKGGRYLAMPLGVAVATR